MEVPVEFKSEVSVVYTYSVTFQVGLQTVRLIISNYNVIFLATVCEHQKTKIVFVISFVPNS